MDSGEAQRTLMLWLVAVGMLSSTANAESPHGPRSVVLCLHGGLTPIVKAASKMSERERSSAMGHRRSSGYFTSSFFDSDKLNRLLTSSAESDLNGLFPVFADGHLHVHSGAYTTDIDDNAEFVLSISAGSTLWADDIYMESIITRRDGWIVRRNTFKEVLGIVPLTYRLTCRGNGKPVLSGRARFPLTQTVSLGTDRFVAELRNDVPIRAIVRFDRCIQSEVAKKLLRRSRPIPVLRDNAAMVKTRIMNPLPVSVSGTIKCRAGDFETSQNIDLPPKATREIELKLVPNVGTTGKPGRVISFLRQQAVVSFADLRLHATALTHQ